MVITKSIAIKPGNYYLPAPASLDSPVIIIRGNNITVDFAHAELQGSRAAALPDERAGLAILIDGGTNITLRNARIHGYKIAILAHGTRNLRLLDNDVSDNWKPRLFSLIEHESLADWLSHHRNDKDEWLRFGAGIYLIDVRGGEIKGNRIERGMEGLMLTRTDSLRIWNNTIEFNSGVGIGLYRSSYNTIMHNHASYNVRGYSEGFYRRGQDSADLLMYEQSSHNVVAFNSMTHGGDGLFLWAGQSTMDTGEGGANDNLFYANDFSYAPTNAMEATFSRNLFIGNQANGSEYGLWGGYSFESRVIGNEFKGNRTGIAIEHGQQNEIANNLFHDDSVAINLWANPIEPSDWGYPKHRDTRSRDYRIADNVFRFHRVGLRVAATGGAALRDNVFVKVDSVLVVRDSSKLDIVANDTLAAHGRVDTGGVLPLPAAPQLAGITLPKPMTGGLDPKADRLAALPRSAIIVDEWGPYDWSAPKLWPADSSHATPLKLRVLGPAGSWRTHTSRGVASMSKQSGSIGDTIVIAPARGSEQDWQVTLVANINGRAQRFSYERFNPASGWDIRFSTWVDSANVNGPIVYQTKAPRLDYMWYRPSIKEVPQSKFAVLATTSVDLAPGEYTLRAISDDGVRVWVDDKLAIDAWQPHDSKVDAAPVAAGKHAIRVEYYQKDGWMELRVEVVKGVIRSEGSPGPH